MFVGPNPQGKEVLQHLVRDYRPEYDKLTSQEQAELIQEFDEYKSAKATGFRISMKARVNDVTKTLQAVENEVCKFESAQQCKLMDFSWKTSNRALASKHFYSLRAAPPIWL